MSLEDIIGAVAFVASALTLSAVASFGLAAIIGSGRRPE